VFSVGSGIVVDVGAAQETTTIQALSGLSATAVFANTHTAPYPVWPDGAEWAVRRILARIRIIENQMSGSAPFAAGVAQADEVKLYASSKGQQRGATHDMLGSLVEQRALARDDLAGAVGVPNLWRLRAQGGGASSSTAPY